MKLIIVTFFAWIILIGCSSTPPQLVILSPVSPTTAHAQSNSSSTIHITVLDRRKANYVASIKNGDEVRRLLAPATPPRATLLKVIKAGFSKAGYRVNSEADLQLIFYIDDLLAQVQQNTFDFDVKTRIQLSLKAESPRQHFSKRYRVKGSMQGPLSLDHNKLEQQLNDLITQLTTDIMNDEQLIKFIQ
ncbi:hypothetical protein D5R81_05635 [Parashewanella spongiae]|uniref:Lipoprotein n=1 Tax=Parashewanella spongiae TaxID=342950 RepID=A0A3A6TQQ9_9GAMM|nr:YajG family lipoprotein [Parashewanella spongiae]MCL1077436.1 YajG family lipoprotein [Parashewanella spongiae]RJY18349.1 hypothetical protein D5R81_05635 [Parashewanella spongiae]